jgi:hypothetical protein
MNRNEIDFTERMQAGRDLAQVARNKGQSTGKRAGCQYPKRTYHDIDRASWAWLCEETRRAWRSDKAAALNTFQAACLNGPGWQDDLDSLGQC